ncbi:peptidase S28 [Ramaria rubella]|nr:peptidase S28 [Ramaria rubella]
MHLTFTAMVSLGAVAAALSQTVQEAARWGPGAVKMYMLEQDLKQDHGVGRHLLDPSPNQQPLLASLYAEFPPRYFTQPLNHFDSSNYTFLQRYWVSTRHYQKGGPVFVLDGGETSGEDRLPFLDTGILDILAEATNGLGIVLEHRYYGTSIPVANFSTDSLRWLNNAQSAADSAHFMANLKVDGINETIASPSRPWIYYGGSYAGARAAHMRVLYPSLVFGSIASSAVTHAALYNWEYTDLIRNYTDPACREAIDYSIGAVDRLLSRDLTRIWVKSLFGLRGLRQDQDFASILQSPFGSWQSMNWDPTVGSTKFHNFCHALVGTKPHGWGDVVVKHLNVAELQTLGNVYPVDYPVDSLAEAVNNERFHFALFNYARYIRENVVSRCPRDMTVEECFGTSDPTSFQNTSVSSTWRAWTFQVCTEWGYFNTAPPDPNHPTFQSRLLDLEYVSRICRLAFPPGEHFIVPSWPNVTAVNALGDFDIAADRLAFVDGEIDPWRPATPHSDYASPRNDTILRPFKLIPGGVHHWDENGLRDSEQEPADIQKIHGEEVEFVKAWLKDWVDR